MNVSWIKEEKPGWLYKIMGQINELQGDPSCQNSFYRLLFYTTLVHLHVFMRFSTVLLKATNNWEKGVKLGEYCHILLIFVVWFIPIVNYRVNGDSYRFTSNLVYLYNKIFILKHIRRISSTEKNANLINFYKCLIKLLTYHYSFQIWIFFMYSLLV